MSSVSAFNLRYLLHGLSEGETNDIDKHYDRLTITDLKRTHSKCHPRERDAGKAR